MAEKTVRRLTIRSMMVLVAIAAGIAWGFSLQFGKDLRIAADHQQDVTKRKEAVARLSQEDQQKLNRYLTDRLPGDWDLGTIHDLEILDVVGDSQTIVKLQKIYEEATDDGKISTAILGTMNDLQARQHSPRIAPDARPSN